METLVDGSRRLDLVDGNGYVVEALDLGFPVVREVVDPRPQADGTFDSTAHHGSRAVSLTVSVFPNGENGIDAQVDLLRSFCRPAARPQLEFDGRFLRLRVDQQSAPHTHLAHRRMRLQWVAPDGRILSTTEKVVQANPAASDDGRTYDLIFDRDYPTSAGVGVVSVDNEGTTTADPILRMHGPCTSPRIENQTTGQRLEFTARGGLTIAAGDYLEVNTQNRTARLNGDQNRLQYLNFADPSASEWWSLEPGVNGVRFYPVTSSAPSVAEIRWRDSWL